MSDNSSKLKVPSDGPEKRFWLFDFDGVAVNLQIPLVNKTLLALKYSTCAKGHPSLPPVTHSTVLTE